MCVCFFVQTPCFLHSLKTKPHKCWMVMSNVYGVVHSGWFWLVLIYSMKDSKWATYVESIRHT